MAEITMRGKDHCAVHQGSDYGTTAAQLLPAGDDPLAYAVYKVEANGGTPDRIVFRVQTQYDPGYHVLLAKPGSEWERRGPYQGEQTVDGLGSDYVVNDFIRYAVLVESQPGAADPVTINETVVTVVQIHV